MPLTRGDAFAQVDESYGSSADIVSDDSPPLLPLMALVRACPRNVRGTPLWRTDLRGRAAPPQRRRDRSMSATACKGAGGGRAGGGPRLRVDVAQLGGVDESVHCNGLLAAALGAREQPGAPYAKPIWPKSLASEGGVHVRPYGSIHMERSRMR